MLKETRPYVDQLNRAAVAGLGRLIHFLETKAKVSDDDRLAAKLGLGAVSTAVRLESAITNRMAVELMREKYEASLLLPAGPTAAVSE